ncbi:MAG: FliM/FliN family flagellar motor switch protein [Planctomycetota bacterium]
MPDRTDPKSVLNLEVPVIVRLGSRRMPSSAVMNWVPGSIIELPKHADEPLELHIRSSQIGAGTAVKVGENFGIRVVVLGSKREIAEAVAEARRMSAEAA